MSENKKQSFFGNFFEKKKKQSSDTSEFGSIEPNKELMSESSADDNLDAQTPQQALLDENVKSKGKPKLKGKKRKEQVSEPLNLYIGYYANVKPKELREFMFNYATSHVTPIENAYYNIQPYMDGYLWEIHEGGSGKGCLKSIKSILDHADKVTIIRDNFSIVVVRDEDKVSTSKITSSNLKYHSANDDVEFADSMKTFVSEGFGFFVSSLLVLAVSSVILGSAFVNRNTERTRITNEHLYDQIIDLPIAQIGKIKSHLGSEETGIYVQDLKYSRGKKQWIVKTVPTPDYARIKTNVIGRLRVDDSDKKGKPEVNAFKELNDKKASKSKQDALDNLAKKQGN
ncbi:hypothetical protein LMH73_012255 [Vibrio splendidus]|nr:hypothetical protein [Vibrio splendidus]MCC4880418.1 hypothetical protein [Vibrio splendidus]